MARTKGTSRAGHEAAELSRSAIVRRDKAKKYSCIRFSGVTLSVAPLLYLARLKVLDDWGIDPAEVHSDGIAQREAQRRSMAVLPVARTARGARPWQL